VTLEDAQYDKGIKQFTAMVGDERIDSLRQSLREASPDFERLVMAFVGGEVWTRPVLELKTRSLCSIGILAALGRQNALRLNVRMALANGAQAEEIREVFVQVAVYAGFAAAWDGLAAVASVLGEEASG
jgi:4-carboxymuconolactone decarboxylase